jgi:hypothetical protein
MVSTKPAMPATVGTVLKALLRVLLIRIVARRVVLVIGGLVWRIALQRRSIKS